jgi:hypothetical protein
MVCRHALADELSLLNMCVDCAGVFAYDVPIGAVAPERRPGSHC